MRKLYAQMHHVGEDGPHKGDLTLVLYSEAQERIEELTKERNEYRSCAVEYDYARKDFICAMWTAVDQYESDRADLNATCAALAVAAKRDRERCEALELSLARTVNRLESVLASRSVKDADETILEAQLLLTDKAAAGV